MDFETWYGILAGRLNAEGIPVGDRRSVRGYYESGWSVENVVDELVGEHMMNAGILDPGSGQFM